MKKSLFHILIISAFLTLFFSFLFFNKCIPDGCDFSNACSSGSCANETLTQHLGEKDFLQGIIIQFQKFLTLFVVILGAFLVFRKYLFGKNEFLERILNIKYKARYLLKLQWVDHLTLLFSDGILNPKIY